jgi:hypothetical protein
MLVEKSLQLIPRDQVDPVVEIHVSGIVYDMELFRF